MAKIQGFKRIESGDFKPEVKQVIDKLGYSLNIFNEEVFNAFQKNITFDNLNQNLTSFVVSVDATGVPQDETLLRPGTQGFNGISCISAENLDNDSFPTGQPFITFQRLSNGAFRILNVTGLPANTRFRLTVIIYGI